MKRALLRYFSAAFLSGLLLTAALAASAPSLGALLGNTGNPLAGTALACTDTGTQSMRIVLSDTGSGNQTYTNSATVHVDDSVLPSFYWCSWTYYFFIMSNQSGAIQILSQDADGSSSSGKYGEVFYLGHTSTGPLNASFNYDMSAHGGSASDGTHTVYYSIDTCTANSTGIGAQAGAWETDSTANYQGPWGWLISHNGGSCLNIVSVQTETIILDATAPASSSTSPASSASASVAVTSTFSDALSGVKAVRVYASKTSTVGSSEYLCGTVGSWADDNSNTTIASPQTITCNLSTAASSLGTSVDGTWYFRSSAFDRAGNTEASPASYDDTTLVDTTAPTAGVPAPSKSYANAAANSWTVNWTAASDATSGVSSVSITELYATASGGACPAAGGSWTVAWTNPVSPATATSYSVSNGGTNTCYAYKINVTDAVGNTYTTAQGSGILTDLNAPSTVSFTAPSASPTYQSSTSYTFAWNAASDTGGSLINNYQRVLQRAAISSSGVCSGSYTNITDHGLSTATSIAESGVLTAGYCWREAVDAFDKAGNDSGWAYSNPVLVDATAPSAPTVTNDTASRTCAAAASSTATTIYFRPACAATVSLTPSSTDAESGVASYTFGTPSPSTGWTVTGSGASRSYNFSASAGSASTALSATNNASLTSSATSVSLVADSVAPSIAFTAPSSDLVVSSSSYAVTFNATDAGAGFTGSALTTKGWSLQRQVATATSGVCGSFANDGSAVSGTTNANGQTNTQTLTTDNCYRWVLSATDAVGNSASAVTSSSVLYDGTPPPAPTVIGSGSNIYQTGDTIWFNSSGSGTVDLTATTIDSDSGNATGHHFGAPSSTAGWSPTSATDVSGNPSTSEYHWTGGASDTVITVSATNPAGLTGLGTDITLRGDSTGPTIDWTYPDEGGTYIPSSGSGGLNYVTLNWSATDAESGMPADGSSQSLQRQSGPIVTAGSCAGVSWSDDGGTTTGNPPQSASGLTSGYCYRWVLTAADNVGNTSTATSGSVLIDTTDPTGILSAMGADGGTTTTRSQDITVTCSCTDAESDIANVRYAIDGGYDWSTTPWLTWPANATHAMTLNSGSGTYTILAQIQDYAGNIKTISVNITLQNGVEDPTLTAAALIVDCTNPSDQSKWQFNSTGVIYWPVGRQLCLVPDIYQTAEGIDTRDTAQTKYGNLTDWWGVSPPPDKTSPWLVSYKLGANGNDTTKSDVTWPTSIDTVIPWNASSPTVLRFVVNKETAALTTSVPYILVSYELDATQTWCTETQGGGTCDAPEDITPALTLRIIALNSGQVRP